MYNIRKDIFIQGFCKKSIYVWFQLSGCMTDFKKPILNRTCQAIKYLNSSCVERCEVRNMMINMAKYTNTNVSNSLIL